MAQNVEIVISAKDQTKPAFDGVKSNSADVSKNLDSIRNAASGADASLSKLDQTLQSAAQVVAGGFIAREIIVATGALVQAQLAAEKLQKTLEFTSGGNAAAAAKDLDYLRTATNRLGVEFGSASTAYVKFAAASKGTALEGEQTKRIFESISKAATVMGLSADETSGALLALQQMVSKGKVQAEELRGQLGERLPGAFQIAARAMGLTTAQLDKMLAAGEVLAEDLLPKLATQLDKELGPAAEKAANSLQSQINRMLNAWEQFKQSISKSVVNPTVVISVTQALQGGNNVAKVAEQKGYGGLVQSLGAVGGFLFGAAGAETDPRQIRENKLSDAYQRLSKINDSIADPTKAYERDRLRKDAADVQALINRLEEAKRKAFADLTVKRSKELGDSQTPEQFRQYDEKLKQEKAQKLADWQDFYDKHLTKAEQYKKSLEELNKAADKAGISRDSAQYKNALKDIQDKAADKSSDKAAREAEQAQRRLNDLLAEGEGESAQYAEKLKLLSDALFKGKITTEQYSQASRELWITNTKAGKAYEDSEKAADKFAHTLNKLKTEHANQIASINQETASIGQSAEARKLAAASLAIDADARKKIAELDEKLVGPRREKAIADIKAEAEAYKKSTDAALRKQQAVAGAYQLEQDNRRFAADSILDERDRSRALLEIDAETWRERIQLAADGSDERKRLESSFQQWYANQLSKPAIEAARKFIDSIDQTFHDSYVRLLEDGKSDWDALGKALGNAFKSAAAEEIYKLTIKPIVVNIVGAFTSGVVGAVGNAAAAEATGGAQAQQGLGILSGVQTAFAGVNGGITKAATTFANSGFGQAAGLSVAPGVATTETAIGTLQVETAGGLTAAGSTFAAAAGPVLGALAATYAIAEMQKSGWGSDNNAKNYATDFFLRGGTGVSVIADRLFGHSRNVSNDAQGISGTFDLSGFIGQSFQERSQKGGTFSKDKRWTDFSAIGSDMDKALDSMLKQAVSGVQTIGKALNVETENALQGFSHTFALQLSENGDMSKAGEKIAAELKKVQDELATRLVPNIADFARYGESASDTFSRLNQEITATDAILLAMGKNAGDAFGAVGLASIKAREDLIDLAGGLDKLASKTQAYYQAYYSSGEQLQLAAKQAQSVLVGGFADIGQSIPATRAEFRALVEAQDLSTEAGRKLWNSLLDLSDEFDTVQKLADAAAASLANAKQSQATLFDTFANDAQKLEAAKKLVGDTFSSIGKAVPDSTAAFLSLSQSIDPATEAGQGLIAALAKVSNAFAYVATASDAAARATLGAKAGKIEGDMQSLVDRFGSLSPVARTVADDLAATQQQLAGLSDGLANLFNTAQLTDLQKLGQSVGYREQIRGAISSLNDDIFEAMLKGMSRPQQIDALKKAEADLWSGMGGAADKGAQASKIRAIVLRRLGLESEGATAEASKAADLAKQARQDQIDTLRSQIDGMQRMRDLAKQIGDFTGSLASSDLSTLDFTGQLAAAKSLFESTLASAQGGDTNAQGNLTGNARAYLEEAQAYYASSSNYAAIYEAVNSQLKSFAGSAPTDAGISSAQAQLDAMQKLPEVMAAVVDNSKLEVESLVAVQTALRAGDDYLTKSIDRQTDAMQQQIGALQTLATNQQAQIAQAGAAYTAMVDELKAVKAQLAAIESNGALAGSK